MSRFCPKFPDFLLSQSNGHHAGKCLGFVMVGANYEKYPFTFQRTSCCGLSRKCHGRKKGTCFFKHVPLRKSLRFGFVFLFRKFRFLIQPTSSVSLISLVEQPGECVDQCRLSAFDHTSIDLQFFRSLSDGQALGETGLEDLDVIG